MQDKTSTGITNLMDIFTVDFSFNIATHVTILFAILSMFFIFYISKLETTLLQHEIGSAIKNNLTKALQNLDSTGNVKAALKSIPFENAEKLYSQPNEAVEVGNKWLFTIMYMILIGLILSIVLSYLILTQWCGTQVSLGHILLENGIIFTFIGIVEYLFFTNVAIKYIPAPPSLLVNSVIDSLKKNV